MDTLTEDEARELAKELQLRLAGKTKLNFASLPNKRAVEKECRKLGVRTFSRTAHGSLLDPRYTVEGRHLPDKGLANNYKQYQPKLYILEVDR